METFELLAWASVTVGDLTVKNLWGGHKISRNESGGRGGDLTYADLEFGFNGGTESWMAYHPEPGEGERPYMDIGPYRICILSVGWNGEHARFTVERTAPTAPHADAAPATEVFPRSQPVNTAPFVWTTVVLKWGETSDFRNIRITHSGGTQKIAFDGSDPSNVHLVLTNTDTGETKEFRTEYENTTGSADADLRFGTIAIRIVKISPGAAEVTLIIREDSAE